MIPDETTKASYAWTAAALVVTALVHATYVPNGFTWLDHGDIVGGRAVVPLREALSLFTRPFGETGFYRPLVALSLSLDRAVYGASAWGYHLTNVLLHVAACAAFARFAKSWVPEAERWIPVAVAVAGVHAASWLPVGSISYRPELLAAVFTFLSVAAFCRGHGLATFLFFLLGTLSKESVIVWVPGLVILRVWSGPRTEGLAGRLPAPVAAVVLYVVARTAAVGLTWRPEWPSMTLVENVGTRLHLVGKQMMHLLSPVPSGLSDAVTVFHRSNLETALGAAAVVAFAWLLCGRRVDDPRGRVVLFTAVALSPSLNLLPLPRATSPHYAYLATFGVGMAAVLVAQAPGRRRSLRAAGVLVWTLVACAATAGSGGRFRDDRTLFAPEVARDARFREGWAYLGDWHRTRGELAEAEAAYRSALDRRPGVLSYVDAAAVAVNLGDVLRRTGRDSAALELLAVVNADRGPADQNAALYNRALILAERGEDEAVVRLLERVQFDRPEPYLLLARSLGRVGREEEARRVLSLARPMLSEEQTRRMDRWLGDR